jgi:hypothetical protein
MGPSPIVEGVLGGESVDSPGVANFAGGYGRPGTEREMGSFIMKGLTEILIGKTA